MLEFECVPTLEFGRKSFCVGRLISDCSRPHLSPGPCPGLREDIRPVTFNFFKLSETFKFQSGFFLRHCSPNKHPASTSFILIASRCIILILFLNEALLRLMPLNCLVLIADDLLLFCPHSVHYRRLWCEHVAHEFSLRAVRDAHTLLKSSCQL